jgi:hypothetical protein
MTAAGAIRVQEQVGNVETARASGFDVLELITCPQ